MVVAGSTGLVVRTSSGEMPRSERNREDSLAEERFFGVAGEGAGAADFVSGSSIVVSSSRMKEEFFFFFFLRNMNSKSEAFIAFMEESSILKRSSTSPSATANISTTFLLRGGDGPSVVSLFDETFLDLEETATVVWLSLDDDDVELDLVVVVVAVVAEFDEEEEDDDDEDGSVVFGAEESDGVPYNCFCRS